MIKTTGVLCAAVMVAFAMPALAGGKTLVTLSGTNGEDVFSSLTQGSDGNLYGTTEFGGTKNAGTVFQMTPKGKYTVLYDFCSQSGCADGANGEWLTEGSDGNFYGMTYTGGSANLGTIFEITPSGQFTSLYSFCSQSQCTDGASPQSQLVQASDGSFWGTTTSGGANNRGTVFKFTPGNAPTIVYSFCAQSNCTDGSYPYIGLTLANDGNFYGVTAEGGTNGDYCDLTNFGCGTVFRITASGTLTTLYTFCTQSTCLDGAIPQGEMIQAKDGDLYGTTDTGGSTENEGTVFKISLQGKLKTLHAFCSSGECSDGAIPYAGVIQAKNGDIYGTTDLGGPNAWGSVYKLTSKGKLTSVYSVDQTDGQFIAAGVTQAKNGKLYGGTEEGGSGCGSNGCGVIFDVSAKAGHAGAQPSAHRGYLPPNMSRPAIPVSVVSVRR